LYRDHSFSSPQVPRRHGGVPNSRTFPTIH
jgi:hypothetical protein